MMIVKQRQTEEIGCGRTVITYRSEKDGSKTPIYNKCGRKYSGHGAYTETVPRQELIMVDAEMNPVKRYLTIEMYDKSEYEIEILKKDNENNLLQGAKFSVILPGQTKAKEITTDKNGIATVGKITIGDLTTDTITISEVNAPEGYQRLLETCKLTITKQLTNNKYSIKNISANSNSANVKLVGNKVTITINNEKYIPKVYPLKIIKTENGTNTTLSGAEFEVTSPLYPNPTKFTTNGNGEITILDIGNLEENGTDTITISEIKAPEGYKKIPEDIKIEIEKQDGLKNVLLKSGGEYATVTVDKEKGEVTINITDEKSTERYYNLNIVKVDDNTKEPLEGAKFTMKLPGKEPVELTPMGYDGISRSEEQITLDGNIEDFKIIFRETEVPNGYNIINEDIVLHLSTEIVDGQTAITNAQLEKTNFGNVSIENDTITVTVNNHKIEGSMYDINILKVDKDDPNKKLQDAKFSILLPNEDTYTDLESTNENGIATLKNISVTEVGTDTIKIKEIEAPAGYGILQEDLEIEITKKVQNGKYAVAEIKLKETTGNAQVSLNDNTITITIANKKIKNGKYDLQIVKVDRATNQPLQGAKFNLEFLDENISQNDIEMGENDDQQNVETEPTEFSDENNLQDGITTIENDIRPIIETGPTDSNGIITIKDIEITSEKADIIKINEVVMPNGFYKLYDSIYIIVEKEIRNYEYVVKSINTAIYDENELTFEDVTLEGNKIMLKIYNEKVKDSEYDLEIVKKDSESGDLLQGAYFSITDKNGDTKEYGPSGEEGLLNLGKITISGEGKDEVVIKETKAPEGYDAFPSDIKLNISKKVTDYTYVIDKITFEGAESDSVTLEGNKITINVANTIRKTDIGGTVWLDEPGKNGRNDKLDISNVKTEKFEGIKAYLYLADDLETVIQETTTDANGRYSFEDVIENREYIIKFEYFGQQYMPVKYTGLTDENYTEYDSAAKETEEDRTNLNNKFHKIVKGKAIGTNNEEIDLTYNLYSNKHTSVLNRTDVFNSKTIITASTESFRGSDAFAKYINLGLYEREQADLNVAVDVKKVDIEINGEPVYTTGSGYGKKINSDAIKMEFKTDYMGLTNNRKQWSN